MYERLNAAAAIQPNRRRMARESRNDTNGKAAQWLVAEDSPYLWCSLPKKDPDGICRADGARSAPQVIAKKRLQSK